VLVRSDLTKHGIGEMLRQASDYAAARGYGRMECIESSSNEPAVRLEREQGFRAKTHPGSAELTILTKNLGPWLERCRSGVRDNASYAKRRLRDSSS